jgi:hypothetical protein
MRIEHKTYLRNPKRRGDMVNLRGRRDSCIKNGRDYMSKYNPILHDAAPSGKNHKYV